MTTSKNYKELSICICSFTFYQVLICKFTNELLNFHYLIDSGIFFRLVPKKEAIR